jgi:drug/metabolite transporter (DMT)-like permease
MRIRYLLLVAIWGASFLLIKIGLEALAPLQVVLGRMAFGAAALLAVTVVRRVPLPREPRLWGHLFVVATLSNTVPFALFAYAEQRIPSAVASICNATTPLFTLLIALFALPTERPTARRGIGLVLGFVGVAVVFGAWSAATARPDPIGVLLGLGACICYGLGAVYLRRRLSATPYSGLALMAVQLFIGTVQLAVVTPLATAMPAHLPVDVVLAVVVLGVLGTGAGYVFQYALIRGAGPTVATTVTYWIPVVSIGLGVAALGEHVAWNAPLGAAIIIAGAILSRTARRQARKPRDLDACPPPPAPHTRWVRGLS